MFIFIGFGLNAQHFKLTTNQFSYAIFSLCIDFVCIKLYFTFSFWWAFYQNVNNTDRLWVFRLSHFDASNLHTEYVFNFRYSH